MEIDATARGMIWLIMGSIGSAQANPTPPPALDFMVNAVRELCLSQGDRIETARRLVPDGWRLTDIEDHLDMSVAPIFPTEDNHGRGWRGALADGRASLSVEVTYFRDLARSARFSASIGASPEGAIDLDILQRRLGMTLQPSGPPIEGREIPRDPPSSEHGIIVVTSGPRERQFGRMQRFELVPAPTGIEISAVRYWGAGFPEQSLTISCRSREEDVG